MKTLISAALLASVCCVVTPIYGYTYAAEMVNQQAASNESNMPSNQSPSYFHRLFAPENVPNLILCIVGIAGILVGVRTLVAIRDQVGQMRQQTAILVEYNKATRDGADAAIKNAAAVIDSQRARLKIKVNRIEKEGRKGKEIRFDAVATNTSSTIAQIIGVWAIVHHCSLEEFKNLDKAEFPEPSNGTFREPQIIPAQDEWCFKTVYDYELVPFEVKWEVERGKVYPAWYGWIQFRDFVGREHRQRFFFMYSDKAKELAFVGPTGHNAEEY